MPSLGSAPATSTVRKSLGATGVSPASKSGTGKNTQQILPKCRNIEVSIIVFMPDVYASSSNSGNRKKFFPIDHNDGRSLQAVSTGLLAGPLTIHLSQEGN